MKRMIKLTGVNAPERANEAPGSIYVDPDAIITICTAFQRFERRQDREQQIAATKSLWEEVERVTAALAGGEAPKLTVESQVDADRLQGWANARQAAADLTAAARLVDNYANRASYTEPMRCTEIALSCGTAIEHGVMLSRLWVRETPEEVVGIIDQTDPQRPCKTCGKIAPCTCDITPCELASRAAARA